MCHWLKSLMPQLVPSVIGESISRGILGEFCHSCIREHGAIRILPLCIVET